MMDQSCNPERSEGSQTLKNELVLKRISMTKIHLDTDIGGDMDDLCALAMLLKWPDLEITGITTVAEENGRRAGYAHYVLQLMGRSGIPLATGADVSGGYYRHELDYPPEEENWPEPITSLPGSSDEALSLLKHSIEQGAIIVGTGPLTNFALLDQKYPGILKQANLFLMGGYIYDIPDGYPQWDKNMDYNIEVDIHSARHVFEHASPTLVPLTVSCQTALRRAYLPRLAQSGPLGQLIVRQANLFARSEQMERIYGETCPALPKDIINFQHDPLACAIALGWHEGVEIETVLLKLEVKDSWLYEVPGIHGTPTRLVTKINGNAFNEYWCNILCR
jgi:purine nucleosidase